MSNEESAMNNSLPAILCAYGGLPEWSKGAVCKTAGSAYVGSNPTPATEKVPGKSPGDFVVNRPRPATPTSGAAGQVGRYAGTSSRGRSSASGTATSPWWICGNHSSQLGRYQFHFPSSFMVAGSNTARTTVASTRTATASPTPNCLRNMNCSDAKTANTPTITMAALVTTPAVDLMPWATASSLDMPLS